MDPVTFTRLIWFVYREYAIDISPDTLRRSLALDHRVKICSGVPMEMQRVHVTVEALMEYFSTLPKAIDDLPTAFIWNMDEIGHSDWADAHADTMFVPSDFESDSVPIPLNRTGERITLVGCICLDGSFTKPMVVIPRHTVDNDLPLLGVSESNCYICHMASSIGNFLRHGS
jgi:hypothetical protein